MFKKSSSAFYRNTSIGGTRTFLLCWVFTSMNMVHLSIYLSLLRFISSASYNLPSIDPAYILSFDIFLTISIVVCFLWIYMYCYDSHFLQSNVLLASKVQSMISDHEGYGDILASSSELRSPPSSSINLVFSACSVGFFTETTWTWGFLHTRFRTMTQYFQCTLVLVELGSVRVLRA